MTAHRLTGADTLRYYALFLRGSPLRLVFAKSTNCCSLIEFTIWRDAPLRLAFDRSPRLAASAAPAAICCFFDLAGIWCSIILLNGCLETPGTLSLRLSLLLFVRRIEHHSGHGL